MYKAGDHVVFSLDGARGVVLHCTEEKCHVIWEDHFVSWEKIELLQSFTPNREGESLPAKKLL